MDDRIPDDELLRLIRFLIRSKDGFAVGFARGLSPAERKPILEQVSSALAEKETSLRVADYSGRPIQNLYQQLDADGFFAEPHLPTIVLGLESSIFGDDGDRFLRVLNLDRDRFRRSFKAPLFFWLSHAAAIRLQKDAHDFYDYWTGLFDFAERSSAKAVPMGEKRTSAEAGSAGKGGQVSQDEERYLNEEIARHQKIIESLSLPSEFPLEKGVRGISFDDERTRLRAIDSLRILARDLGRLGKIDEAKTYVEQSLKLMPQLNESASPDPVSIQAWGDFGNWLNDQFTHHNAALAMALIDDHQVLLNAAARGALDLKMYEAAQFLLQPLNKFWNAREMTEEAEEWTDRVLDALEFSSGTPPNLDTDAGGLWLFIVGSRANRCLQAGKIDPAEHAYVAIEKMLSSSGSEKVRSLLVPIYHLLGSVAEKRGDLDSAEHRYEKSLEIEEALGDRQGIAHSCYQLGSVAQQRGDLVLAGHWYRKSLEINEALGDRPGIADTYFVLGTVAEDRGDLSRAEAWYKKSVKIDKSTGKRPNLALTYGQLGLLAEKQGRMQEALDWTVKGVGLLLDLSHPSTSKGLSQLAELTRALGMEALESSWLRCHGAPLPEGVRRGIVELMNQQANEK